jgi:hypothetical protein
MSDAWVALIILTCDNLTIIIIIIISIIINHDSAALYWASSAFSVS